MSTLEKTLEILPSLSESDINHVYSYVLFLNSKKASSNKLAAELVSRLDESYAEAERDGWIDSDVLAKELGINP